MEEKHDEVEDVGSVSSDSFLEEPDDNAATNTDDDGFRLEEPLTEEEIEDLIAELVETESKAAEAQESLEDESLAKVEIEVREELKQSLHGEELEKAVADEMATLREEWETLLDELETESAHLLEQLDGAGIELPSLYKWIESQAPNGCSTEAWKKRTHWVGAPVSNDVAESVAHAEKYLRTQRPVRRRHGKVLEEGASGYLEKKLSVDDSKEASMKNSDVDWSSFNRIASGHKLEDSMSFGSKHWASVYLASTPQQAAEMGLNFPGADQVEEIDDVDGNSSDPLIADAIANEEESILSETHKGKLRKVKEDEDMIMDKKLQLHLKRRRQRNRCKQDAALRADSLVHNENDVTSTDVDLHEAMEISEGIDNTKSASNGTSESSDFALPGLTEARGSKRLHDDTELSQSNKAHIVTIDTDDESHATGIEPSLLGHNESTIPVSTLNLKEEFHCTACHKVATDIIQHPILKVIVCRDCKIFIESKMRIQDPDCSECYCGWCGRNKDLVSCKLCKVLFCNTCIRKNLGEECSLNVKVSGWQCCCCSPSMLQRLTAELEKAIGSTGAIASSSDSESDNSGGNISFTISTKKRRKKKIRRILDDAELGEETKKKIAIEKERQERLKSLEAQFAGKSVLTRSVSFSREVFEGGSAEVLGDALTGYIVNVVREKGEEVVRIPPSISGKLKTHQIAGVRFMWENIVQSITKVKSGDKGLGCILAHTMGLGKTFQVIAFLYTAMRSADLGLRTALIVTPVSVLHNWRHEFNMWKPSELKPLRVYMLEDVPRERRVDLLAKWRKKGGVFLIGYSAFRNLSLGKHTKDRNLAKELCNSLQDGPDILVCDEAHMIKNTRADTTQALKLVKCQRRIALTGSPLQNNLMEYYCMVDFVREGFLGSSHEFRNRFQNPIENGQHTNSTSDDVKIMNQRSHILYEQLKGFVQRMDMSVVQKDLPTKTVYVIAVKLSPLQRKLYKKFLDVHGFAGDKITGEKFQKRNFFAGYQALAQIWNHPGNLQLMKEDKDYRKGEDIIENFAEYSSSDENIDCNMMSGDKPRNKNEIPQKKDRNSFFQEDWWKDLLQRDNYKEIGNSGKMVLLIDILTMSSDVGDKALVFSQSLSTLDLIELYLSKLPRRGRTGKSWKQGKDWYRLDGRTAALERQKLVEKFNDPSNKRVKCTLISTRAGSLGINLHSANRVIIVDGSWNPTHDLQAIYRAWRYGQKKPVFAYRLMAHGTMEEKIYKRQVNKEGLAARVVDRQQVHRTLSKEELLHLFEFGDDELPDPLTEHGQDDGHPFKQTGGDQDLPKQKLTREGNLPSDKFMERLLAKHHPSWIANYHEHETLLQENEDEKLSKEEQDMAWEVYQKTLEWEEVQRIPVDESVALTQKPPVPKPPPSTAPAMSRSKPRLRNHWTKRQCTSMSHMLTLRSQGTKAGCTTICGECAREISWGDKGMK